MQHDPALYRLAVQKRMGEMSCPVHGEQCRRDPRFAELEMYIKAGYGNLRGTTLERVLQANGGALPPRVPEPWSDAYHEAQFQRRSAARMAGNDKRVGKGVLSAEQIAAIPAMVEATNYCATARALGCAVGTVRWHVDQWRRKQRAAVVLKGRAKAA
jgi:hypothetical protein